ncbi:hypothetical protein I4641_07840 [Waterburya agarophytonicola K14]|uniref:Uncharacterized protein n=1 Tax=Waterburya agarophytonicola KI4 TaxID=2874699 RepID=A0A964BQU5_9CYAN|nr:hypothetical protein [Waterburya agarophytonicola]MCC0176888.1 hypothetical protein [Waterburya agarophytonicola KI4]
MFLLKLFRPLTIQEATYNPQLQKARKRHNNLPKTEHDKFSSLAKKNYQEARLIAQERYTELAQILRARIKEHYTSAEEVKINTIVICIIDILASKANIFPDMEYQNVWYTDHYDLIELSRNMGVGDETLPHWEEESNSYFRYLELEISDLVQTILDIAEEALIDPYQAGADINQWFRYVVRETLKSRRRLSRYSQKQNESLWISPKTLGIEDWGHQ